MANSREFKYLWATGQDEKVIELFHRNKLISLFYFLFNKNAYCKILGIYLTAKLQTNGQLNQSEKKKIHFLEKHNFLTKFLTLNNHVVSKGLLSPSKAMIDAQEAFKIIQAQQKKHPFDELLHQHRQATFALVGNAPIQEGNLNLEKKKDIDDKEIVIRFNQFQINKFERHIGSKCSWVAMVSKNFLAARRTTILTDNPLRDYASPEFIHTVLETNLQNTYFVSQEITEELSKKLGHLPSSGLRIIYSFHKEHLSPQLFGFSYFNSSEESENFEHYFEKKKHKEQYHSPRKEKALVRSLFTSQDS